MDQSSSNQITESKNLNSVTFSRQTEMPNQIAAVSQTEIPHMDADLYKTLYRGESVSSKGSTRNLLIFNPN